MSSLKYFGLVFFATNALAAGDGFMIGGGIESDAEDGIRGSVIGGFGVSDKTWLSAGVSKSSVELPIRRDIETLYADLELDHWFDPVGVRVGAAYWGDSDILESNDWRGSLYWRNDKVTLSGEYEFRDFDFIVPTLDVANVREFTFDADGLGVRARISLSDNTSVSVSGMKYDYSIEFPQAENRDVVDLITVSRLSLINSLIDHRASLEFAVDHGLKRWEFDVSTWEGVVDRSRTRSLTIRYLMPMSGKSDIEFGLGYDDSELYAGVTFLSLYLYFYGN